MLNETIQIKVKSRLNKNDTLDYPDLPCWTISEAFNQAQTNFVRSTLQGNDMTKTGAEGSIRRIDDLNILLTEWKPTLIPSDSYYETPTIPADYLQFNRVSVMYKTDCCPPRRMVSYLRPVANVDVLLRDFNERPSDTWGETFHTISGNKIQIYTNGEFTLESPSIVYYRTPRKVEFDGCMDVYTGLPVTTNVTCEFADNIVELLINDTCAILAGDIESDFQLSRTTSIANNNT